MGLVVGDAPGVVRIVALPDDRHLVAPLGKVAIEAVDARVEDPVLEPSNVEVLAGEGGVLHLGERLGPIQPLAELAPVAVWIGLHLPPGGLVARGVHVGPFRPDFRDLENLTLAHVSALPVRSCRRRASIGV